MPDIVIVQSGVNIPPQDEVNKEIAKLGDGWRVVSAMTALEVFGIVKETAMPPIHHVVYVTTVVMRRE